MSGYGYGQSSGNNYPSQFSSTSQSNNSQFGYGNQTGQSQQQQSYSSSGYKQTSSNTHYNQKSSTGSGNLFQDALGGLGKSNNQQQSQPVNPLLGGQTGAFENLAKMIDWDQLLKDKNFTKKQSDTSWVTTQEESWKQAKPSNRAQIESDLKFAFPNPYIKYKIIPGVSQKKALDVTSKDDLAKGMVKGNMIIWDYHGGPNQQFYIHRIGNNRTGRIQDDEFILINASSGFCVSNLNLQIDGKSKQTTQNHVCVYPKLDDYPAQRWQLKPFNKNNEIFSIQSVSSGKVLDCENQGTSNGTNVIQWQANNSKNQAWKILPA